MDLIKCSECGKEFSDKTSACPNCGCPNKTDKSNNNIYRGIGILIICIGIIILIFPISNIFNIAPYIIRVFSLILIVIGSVLVFFIKNRTFK